VRSYPALVAYYQCYLLESFFLIKENNRHSFPLVFSILQKDKLAAFCNYFISVFISLSTLLSCF